MQTDVLIIGAGPAGTTAATMLARNGIDVILVDKNSFPREKICGDGIAPDAIKVIKKIGLEEEFNNKSLELNSLKIYSRNGNHVSIDSNFRSLRRVIFDEMMRSFAVENGSRFISPYILKNSIEENKIVKGAIFKNIKNGNRLEIKSKFTLLATGASAKPLKIFKVCKKNFGHGIAVRAYFKGNQELTERHKGLCISFNKRNPYGYGWVFSLPENLFNIGVGYYYFDFKKATDLRQIWHHFIENFPVARDVCLNSDQVSFLQGGFLRTSFYGTKINRKGLFVLGEAASLTYPFTGEGIGKAMESGLIAAEIISRYFKDKSINFLKVDSLYKNALENKLRDIYFMYKKAEISLVFPFMTNFITWRGNKGKYLAEKISGMIDEAIDLNDIFSVKGFIKSLLY